jgi:hypothetical protein
LITKDTAEFQDVVDADVSFALKRYRLRKIESKTKSSNILRYCGHLGSIIPVRAFLSASLTLRTFLQFTINSPLEFVNFNPAIKWRGRKRSKCPKPTTVPGGE